MLVVGKVSDAGARVLLQGNLPWPDGPVRPRALDVEGPSRARGARAAEAGHISLLVIIAYWLL